MYPQGYMYPRLKTTVLEYQMIDKVQTPSNLQWALLYLFKVNAH
jgi:hypothetical protein